MEITDQKIDGLFQGFTPYMIDCEKGHVHGTHIHETDQICVSHAMCQGCFKELIEYLIKKFNTNKVLIYNIMNIDNWNKIKGFERITKFDEIYGEPVDCLEGEWNTINA